MTCKTRNSGYFRVQTPRRMKNERCRAIYEIVFTLLAFWRSQGYLAQFMFLNSKILAPYLDVDSGGYCKNFAETSFQWGSEATAIGTELRCYSAEALNGSVRL